MNNCNINKLYIQFKVNFFATLINSHFNSSKLCDKIKNNLEIIIYYINKK